MAATIPIAGRYQLPVQKDFDNGQPDAADPAR